MTEESFGDMTLIETKCLNRLYASRTLIAVGLICATVMTLWFGGDAAFNRRELNKFRACHTWALEGFIIPNPSDCLVFDPKEWYKWTQKPL